MARRGFTLLEVVLVCAIVGMLLTVLFFVFTGGQKSVGRGTRLSEAMMGAMLLSQAVELDCCHVAVSRAAAGEPVVVRQGGAALEFAVATPERFHHDERGLAPVTYCLVPPGGGKGPFRVVRGERVLPQVFLESLVFEFLPADETVEPDQHFVRVSGVATDRTNEASFPFTRLVSLPVPSLLHKEELQAERARRKSRGGRSQ